MLGTCPLQTLGVEGVGHHMLNTMNPALCGGATNCFGISSLPDGNAWREDGVQIKERDFVLEDMLDQQFLYNDNSRYVVLLRDPLAAKSSALARFQATNPYPNPNPDPNPSPNPDPNPSPSPKPNPDPGPNRNPNPDH